MHWVTAQHKFSAVDAHIHHVVGKIHVALLAEQTGEVVGADIKPIGHRVAVDSFMKIFLHVDTDPLKHTVRALLFIRQWLAQ